VPASEKIKGKFAAWVAAVRGSAREGGKGQGPGTILEETRALVGSVSGDVTVSVLIFVGLVIHGSMVCFARIL
jgi:hypothetical protein